VFRGASMTDYQHHAYLLIVTTLTVILGGIGFIVWYDIIHRIKEIKQSNHPLKLKRLIIKLNLHTKIVISATAILLFLGTAIFFLIERENPQTIGGLTVGQQLTNSFFMSASTRTAGFTTFPIADIRGATQLIMLVFMFIGGAPTGTAGGIKVTAIVMMLLMVAQIYQGKKEISIFGRTVHQQFLIRAIVVVTMAVTTMFTALIILSLTESIPIYSLILEVVSAFTTVGFSHGYTPQLTMIGGFIVMALMFVGRVGPITMLISFVNKTHLQKEKKEVGYPKEDILIG